MSENIKSLLLIRKVMQANEFFDVFTVRNVQISPSTSSFFPYFARSFEKISKSSPRYYLSDISTGEYISILLMIRAFFLHKKGSKKINIIVNHIEFLFHSESKTMYNCFFHKSKDKCKFVKNTSTKRQIL